MDDSQGMSSAQIALERLRGISRADKIEAERGVPGLSAIGIAGNKGDPGVAGIAPAVANSVEATLAQRGSRYGDFTDHAEICQDLKDVMVSSETKVDGRVVFGWSRLSNVQKQALEVIMDKVARILSGDPNYDDNWHDIQGYAKLVEDRLPKVTETK